MSSKGQEITSERGGKIDARKGTTPEAHGVDLSSVQVAREAEKTTPNSHASSPHVIPRPSSELNTLTFTQEARVVPNLHPEARGYTPSTSAHERGVSVAPLTQLATTPTQTVSTAIKETPQPSPTKIALTKGPTSPTRPLTIFDKVMRWIERVIEKAVRDLLSTLQKTPILFPLSPRRKKTKEEEEREREEALLPAEERIARARKRAEEAAQRIHTE